MNHCDLCGKQSDRLSRVDDLFGLGVSTLCADPAECAETWAPGFSVDPNETAVIRHEQLFSELDKVEPPRRTHTRRIVRA